MLLCIRLGPKRPNSLPKIRLSIQRANFSRTPTKQLKPHGCTQINWQTQQAPRTSPINPLRPTSLHGTCSCGSTGFNGKGAASINFTCHCSICRNASKNPKASELGVSASGFKPEQVEWINEKNISAVFPQNSKNQRYYCNSCGDYLGENCLRTLGVIALSLDRCQDFHESYLPNHHIFFGTHSRSPDCKVSDSIPKWDTIPQSTRILELDDPKETREYDVSSGRYWKDVFPLSPTREPYPKEYFFTEVDPIPNHVTVMSQEKLDERKNKKYFSSPGKFIPPTKKKRDVIVVGGGHNGLVTAAYLAKAGLDVLVLERREIYGGAAVTEEIFPGFKFSRASYLAGLLRPIVIKELNLEKYGFKYIIRDPSSFTPTHEKGKYLVLGSDDKANWESIAQFSKKDADAFVEYENFLHKVREVVSPLIDSAPPEVTGTFSQKAQASKELFNLMGRVIKHKDIAISLYELFTAPASHILDRWFESEIVKTTLAVDAVIGAMISPTNLGSAYVLLHHVMGSSAGREGVWSYVEGGMGSVSKAIAESAKSFGVEIVTNAHVDKILYKTSGLHDGQGIHVATWDSTATGVKMMDGSILEAKTIISNATPYHTFLELLPGLAEGSDNPLAEEFVKHIRFADYSCGAVKINLALSGLPNYTCCPNQSDKASFQHFGTSHFETKMQDLEDAYREASMGIPASRPIIDMTIPSSLDPTLAPEGQQVCQLFVQYAPYSIDPKVGNWADEKFKNAFAERVFNVVEEFCPGFKKLIIHKEILSPLDLERIFALHKGNIMHGALSLHQLAYARPAPGYSSHRTPMQNLYICGAGTHPGGGVMGAAGRNCAKIILGDLKIPQKF